ncbi:MAG: hypothetical protein AAGA48_11960 [Myxococcota bacterium]
MWGVWVLWATWLGSWALAGPFDKLPEKPEVPDEVPEDIKKEIEGDADEKASEVEEARKRYEERQKLRDARVVVVQWPGTRADYSNLDLQRNVRNRIARPSAKFYPEIDMFQPGRTKSDPTLRPSEHLPAVPDSMIDEVNRLVDDVAGTPYDALSETAWGLKAAEMVRLATDEVWFVDRPELLEPLFRLYAYTGYAGENNNTNSPPYYQIVSGRLVNYYYYLAATLAYRTPSLLSSLAGDRYLSESISNYRDAIESGQFERLKLSFEDTDASFDPKFASDYKVLLNGIEAPFPDDSGVIEVPLGVVDINLARKDQGFGLSQRFRDPQFDEDFFFVRTNARKRMGTDLKNQLMVNPNECIPALDGDILNYLAVYAKLHEPQELFIVVPESGSTAPSRLYIWRWDRQNSVLKLVQDNTGGFPVIFAGLATVGASFATFSFPDASEQDLGTLLQSGQPPNFEPTLNPEALPFDFQVRGHYNRFMFGLGAQLKIGLSGPFFDKFPSQGGVTFKTECPADSPTEINGQGEAICQGGAQPEQVPAVNEQMFQRNIYLLAGVMLGPDAALGTGPRGYLRVGRLNVPNALDTTLHFGITPQLTKPSEKTGTKGSRFKAIADVDAFFGIWTPVFDSIYVTGTSRFGSPRFTFGLSGGAGFTF